jgi:signal transduction histidine kinase
VVKDASDDIRRVAGDTIELVLEPAPLLPTVYSDADHVRDAIAQLVQNARDAVPSGGRLTINTAVVTLSADGPATQLDLALGDYVTLAVTDT